MIAATHEPVLYICTRTAQSKDALGCKSVGVNAQEGRLAWRARCAGVYSYQMRLCCRDCIVIEFVFSHIFRMSPGRLPLSVFRLVGILLETKL